jgi:hypothetical protein
VRVLEEYYGFRFPYLLSSHRPIAVVEEIFLAVLESLEIVIKIETPIDSNVKSNESNINKSVAVQKDKHINIANIFFQ